MVGQQNVKEALQKNFARKLNQKKAQRNVQEETKQSINDLRNEFQIQLGKVYENHTRKEGVQACFRIIQRNNDNPSALRVILAALCDRSTLAANPDKKAQGLMFHVQMFGFVAKCFKTELKDPLDKPPSVVKSVIRIQDAIYAFFKENSKVVWKGCAVSLTDIFDNCFPDKTQPVQGQQSLTSFILEPLLNFHKGGNNTMMQQGASFCIMHFIEHLITQNQGDLLEQVHQGVMQSITKNRIDNESQLAAAVKLIQTLGIRVAQDHVEGLVNISIKVIGSQASTVFQKKAACDLLNILGEHLKDSAAHVVPSYMGDVMKSLESLDNEKQIDLSESRNKAKLAWNQLQTIYDSLDPKEKESLLANFMAKNLQNKFSKLRDRVKETREQQRAQSANSRIMHDNINDEINQSYRMLAQDFLKKGKGQGGGLFKGTVNFSPSASKDKKLYEELKRIQDLNSFMMVGGQESNRGRSVSPNRNNPFSQDFLPQIDESQITPGNQSEVDQSQISNLLRPGQRNPTSASQRQQKLKALNQRLGSASTGINNRNQNQGNNKQQKFQKIQTLDPKTGKLVEKMVPVANLPSFGDHNQQFMTVPVVDPKTGKVVDQIVPVDNPFQQQQYQTVPIIDPVTKKVVGQQTIPVPQQQQQYKTVPIIDPVTKKVVGQKTVAVPKPNQQFQKIQTVDPKTGKLVEKVVPISSNSQNQKYQQVPIIDPVTKQVVDYQMVPVQPNTDPIIDPTTGEVLGTQDMPGLQQFQEVPIIDPVTKQVIDYKVLPVPDQNQKYQSIPIYDQRTGQIIDHKVVPADMSIPENQQNRQNKQFTSVPIRDPQTGQIVDQKLVPVTISNQAPQQQFQKVQAYDPVSGQVVEKILPVNNNASGNNSQQFNSGQQQYQQVPVIDPITNQVVDYQLLPVPDSNQQYQSIPIIDENTGQVIDHQLIPVGDNFGQQNQQYTTVDIRDPQTGQIIEQKVIPISNTGLNNNQPKFKKIKTVDPISGQVVEQTVPISGPLINQGNKTGQQQYQQVPVIDPVTQQVVEYKVVPVPDQNQQYQSIPVIDQNTGQVIDHKLVPMRRDNPNYKENKKFTSIPIRDPQTGQIVDQQIVPAEQLQQQFQTIKTVDPNTGQLVEKAIQFLNPVSSPLPGQQQYQEVPVIDPVTKQVLEYKVLPVPDQNQQYQSIPIVDQRTGQVIDHKIVPVDKTVPQNKLRKNKKFTTVPIRDPQTGQVIDQQIVPIAESEPQYQTIKTIDPVSGQIVEKTMEVNNPNQSFMGEIQKQQQYQEVPVIDPVTKKVLEYKVLPVPDQNQQYQSIPIIDQRTGQVIDHKIVPADMSIPQNKQRKNKKFASVPIKDPYTGQIVDQKLVPLPDLKPQYQTIQQRDPISGQIVEKTIQTNPAEQQQQFQEVPVIDPITKKVVEYKVLPVPDQNVQYQSIPIYNKKTGAVIDHKIVPADMSLPVNQNRQNQKFTAIPIVDPQTGQVVDQQIVPFNENQQQPKKFKRVKIVDPVSGQVIEKTVPVSSNPQQNFLDRQQPQQQYQEVPVIDPVTKKVLEYKVLPVPDQNQQYQSIPVIDQRTGQVIDHKIVPADMTIPQNKQRKNKKFTTVPIRDPQTGQIVDQQIVPIQETKPEFRKVKTRDPRTGQMIEKTVPINVPGMANPVQIGEQQYQEVPVIDPITKKIIDYQVLAVPDANKQYQSVPIVDKNTGQILDHKLVPVDNQQQEFTTIPVKDPQTGIIHEKRIPIQKTKFKKIKTRDPVSGRMVEKTVPITIPGAGNASNGEQQYQEVPVIDPVTQQIIDYQVLPVPDGNQQYQSIPIIDQNTGQVIDHKLVPVQNLPTSTPQQQFQSIPIMDPYTGQITGTQQVPKQKNNLTAKLAQQQSRMEKVQTLDPVSGKVVEKVVPVINASQLNNIPGDKSYQQVPIIDPVTKQIVDYQVLPVPDSTQQYQSIPIIDQSTGQVIDHKLVPTGQQATIQQQNQEFEAIPIRDQQTGQITGTQMIPKQNNPVTQLAKQQQRMEKIQTLDPQSGKIVDKVVPVINASQLNNLPGEKSYQQVPVIDPITQQVIDYQVLPIPDSTQQYQSIPVYDETTGQVIDHKLVPTGQKASLQQQNQRFEQVPIRDPQTGQITGTQMIAKQNNPVQQMAKQQQRMEKIQTLDPISGHVVEKVVPVINASQLNNIPGEKSYQQVPVIDPVTKQIIDYQVLPIPDSTQQYQSIPVYDDATGQVIDHKLVPTGQKASLSQQNQQFEQVPIRDPQTGQITGTQMIAKQNNPVTQIAKKQQRMEKVQTLDPLSGQVVEKVVPVINASQLNNIPGEKSYQQVPVLDPVTKQVIDYKVLPVPDSTQQYQSIPIIDQNTGQVIDHKLVPTGQQATLQQQQQEFQEVPTRDPQTGQITGTQIIPKQTSLKQNSIVNQLAQQQQRMEMVQTLDPATGQLVEKVVPVINASQLNNIPGEKQYQKIPVINPVTQQVIDYQVLPVPDSTQQYQSIPVIDQNTGQIIDHKLIPTGQPATLQQQQQEYQSVPIRDPQTGQITGTQMVPKQNSIVTQMAQQQQRMEKVQTLDPISGQLTQKVVPVINASQLNNIPGEKQYQEVPVIDPITKQVIDYKVLPVPDPTQQYQSIPVIDQSTGQIIDHKLVPTGQVATIQQQQQEFQQVPIRDPQTGQITGTQMVQKQNNIVTQMAKQQQRMEKIQTLDPATGQLTEKVLPVINASQLNNIPGQKQYQEIPVIDPVTKQIIDYQVLPVPDATQKYQSIPVYDQNTGEVIDHKIIPISDQNSNNFNQNTQFQTVPIIDPASGQIVDYQQVPLGDSNVQTINGQQYQSVPIYYQATGEVIDQQLVPLSNNQFNQNQLGTQQQQFKTVPIYDTQTGQVIDQQVVPLNQPMRKQVIPIRDPQTGQVIDQKVVDVPIQAPAQQLKQPFNNQMNQFQPGSALGNQQQQQQFQTVTVQDPITGELRQQIQPIQDSQASQQYQTIPIYDPDTGEVVDQQIVPVSQNQMQNYQTVPVYDPISGEFQGQQLMPVNQHNQQQFQGQPVYDPTTGQMINQMVPNNQGYQNTLGNNMNPYQNIQELGIDDDIFEEQPNFSGNQAIPGFSNYDHSGQINNGQFNSHMPTTGQRQTLNGQFQPNIGYQNQSQGSMIGGDQGLNNLNPFNQYQSKGTFGMDNQFAQNSYGGAMSQQDLSESLPNQNNQFLGGLVNENQAQRQFKQGQINDLMGQDPYNQNNYQPGVAEFNQDQFDDFDGLNDQNMLGTQGMPNQLGQVSGISPYQSRGNSISPNRMGNQRVVDNQSMQSQFGSPEHQDFNHANSTNQPGLGQGFQQPNIFDASPNTQSRMINEQRQKLKEQQERLLQNNPQLSRYQQHKEFLEDKLLAENQPGQMNTNDQNQMNNLNFLSDPTDIDGGDDMSSAQHSPGRAYQEQNPMMQKQQFSNQVFQPQRNTQQNTQGLPQQTSNLGNLQNSPGGIRPYENDMLMDSLQPNYKGAQNQFSQDGQRFTSPVTTSNGLQNLSQNNSPLRQNEGFNLQNQRLANQPNLNTQGSPSQLIPGQLSNNSSQSPIRGQNNNFDDNLQSQNIRQSSHQQNMNGLLPNQQNQRAVSPYIEKDLPLIKEEDPDIDNCESDFNDRDLMSTPGQKSNQKSHTLNSLNQQPGLMNNNFRPPLRDGSSEQNPMINNSSNNPLSNNQLRQNQQSSMNPNQNMNQPQVQGVNLKDTHRKIMIAPQKQDTNQGASSLTNQPNNRLGAQIAPNQSVLPGVNNPIKSINNPTLLAGINTSGLQDLNNLGNQQQISPLNNNNFQNPGQKPQSNIINSGLGNFSALGQLPPSQQQNLSQSGIPNVKQNNLGSGIPNLGSQQNIQGSLQLKKELNPGQSNNTGPGGVSRNLGVNQSQSVPISNTTPQNRNLANPSLLGAIQNPAGVQTNQFPGLSSQDQLKSHIPKALPPLNSLGSSQQLPGLNSQLLTPKNLASGNQNINPTESNQFNSQPPANINPLLNRAQNTQQPGGYAGFNQNLNPLSPTNQQLLGQNLPNNLGNQLNSNAALNKPFGSNSLNAQSNPLGLQHRGQSIAGLGPGLQLNPQVLGNQNQGLNGSQSHSLSPTNQNFNPNLNPHNTAAGSQQNQGQRPSSMGLLNGNQGLTGQTYPINITNQRSGSQIPGLSSQILSSQGQQIPNLKTGQYPLQNQQQQQLQPNQNMKSMANLQGNQLLSQNQSQLPSIYQAPGQVQRISQPGSQGQSILSHQSMLSQGGAPGPNGRLAPSNQIFSTQPLQTVGGGLANTNSSGIPSQAAQLITQQILMMQKQMEQGFAKMCDKIEDIETRVDNASNQLQQFEKYQEQRKLRNLNKFRPLSDTGNRAGDFARSDLDDLRDPRFRDQAQTLANHTGQKSPHRQSKLGVIWNKVLDLVKRKQYEDAYRLTMKEADDIYLIRLVAQTGPVVKQLEDKTAFQVINRINKIIRSGAFEAMEIEWIEDANKRGLFQQMSKHEQNEYLDTLFWFSQSKLNPKISERAQDVYQQIKSTAATAKGLSTKEGTKRMQ
ncbi:UNKNOWN [Stylonychia lemnae]|uniref:TORTIFOLIA1/TORL1-2 C-terminal domain-containing protein n=1 Tax=Stylonychia lemnae TaxID=5949 RepID=A0A078B904_STYLE|nr:UNKNOWN [Stylonychia lemnae]|eukprot:CDW90985.1 UNKNOWN [Stylonychia lemnae]